MNEEVKTGIGEILKSARENKGASLQDVEATTFILRRHLEALEEENWEEIPGKSYALGYLKIYSRYLELDETRLVDQFKRTVMDVPQEKPVQEEAPKRSRRRSIRKDRTQFFRKVLTGLVVAAVGVVVIFIVINVDWNRERRPDPETTPIPETTVGVPPVIEGEAVEEEPEPEPEPALFDLEVRLVPEDLAWLEVVSEERNVFTGILVPGKEYYFQSNSPIEFSGRDGNQVQVFLNGQDAGVLAEDGESFTRLIRP